MMLLKLIQQQLRIIKTAHTYFSVELELTIEYKDQAWHYIHDYTRTVMSVEYGFSDSTDRRFVAIRNYITGIGCLYTSVTDEEFAELEKELTNECN